MKSGLMSESKHTPGPWYVDSERTGIMADRNGKREHIAESFFFETGFEAMANARLIAAAPELLEALKGMFNAADEIAAEFIENKRAANWKIINEAYLAAEAAIRKAEARESGRAEK